MASIAEEKRQRGWVNQRATVRYRCAPATFGRVILVEDQEFQRSWVVDLSNSGIGLQLPRPLSLGTFVVIQIKSQSQKKAFELAAHVVHTTLQASGEWLIGCELVNRLNDDDLDELLS